MEEAVEYKVDVSPKQVKKNKCFPNVAGKPKEEADPILKAELEAAGVECHVFGHEFQHPEVHTGVVGGMHGWKFERRWYYWSASGPGIPIEIAEKLHVEIGQELRVAGHCGCPSPREWFGGFGCGSYHIDTPEALKALANAIKAVVEHGRRVKCLNPMDTRVNDGRDLEAET